MGSRPGITKPIMQSCWGLSGARLIQHNLISLEIKLILKDHNPTDITGYADYDPLILQPLEL